jgi:ATP-dependent exoDNAse (exonuclease V) beta subunit
MSNCLPRPAPADQPQRASALDSERSILVQAPAGSGKTDLLTRRFLRLLAEVEDPGQVVAITFTNAAAAEMRNRILGELEKADAATTPAAADEFSIEALAHRALQRSHALGWKLLDLPAQLRISTIDSFCRDLALQQPLLSGLGGGLNIGEQPEELYRRAARRSLERIDEADPEVSGAIAALFDLRDNSWQEIEDLLADMLAKRDRWMHAFVLEREQDWNELRERLERPFAGAIRETLAKLDALFDRAPGARQEALELARFACAQSGNALHQELAELAEFPSAPFVGDDGFEEARGAYLGLAALLLTGEGALRRQVDKRLGFPADRKQEKSRLLGLIAALAAVPGLEPSLASVRALPSARYTEDEWKIVRACFTLLRHAAAELQVVFAEAAAVDFGEVAQIAQRVLKGGDGLPSDAALAVADRIRHLLVDETQDTSRRQYSLLTDLVAAWPDRAGRTVFVVGDPMQSIYFFRDADVELFARLREQGLEIPASEALRFEPVRLTANFRTTPPLVQRLNGIFETVFAGDDGSGVSFTSASPERDAPASPDPRFALHLDFVPHGRRGRTVDPVADHEKEAAQSAQADEIVALIQSHTSRMEEARAHGERYRIAILGRTKRALVPIAAALREARIKFRAVELENLADRPEVLDALALARALFNPQDRVAWLGVLRAPWCGLSLADLHLLTSADDPSLLARPVPDLLAERLTVLSPEGRSGAARVLAALADVPAHRSSQPAVSLGTWLEQTWLRLGGADCVDATGRANLDLLWSCLDRLPDGEPDLLGPALNAALARLTALPDPEAGAACGVQLMTIHKSKGLEFEVVVVPDLQARAAVTRGKMLSWLERGLATPDGSGEITEFLIAPFQPKGEDRGKAREWVDRVYRNREEQEMRRILYVAATRAREELHFFACPACKQESNGDLSLPAPSNCLLATAWPALEDEVRARFEEWESSRAAAANGDEQVIDSIAASASNLVVLPSPAVPTHLRRLPPDYQSAQEDSGGRNEASGASPFPRSFAKSVGDLESQQEFFSSSSESAASFLYMRHEGGLLSRALGTAVHRLFEELGRLRATLEWDDARTALQLLEPRIAAQVRATGIDPAQAARIAAQALRHALNASRDPVGQWILSPHAEAASEVSWAGVVAGTLRTVRVDRVFRAGLAPQSEAAACWWIVDYKTAHADSADPASALPGFRRIFAPQIEAYAQILRNLHGKDAVLRAGLYYPRMLLFDWWEL